jgi:hypothetical protein
LKATRSAVIAIVWPDATALAPTSASGIWLLGTTVAVAEFAPVTDVVLSAAAFG